MEIANASLLDEATAAGEAMTLCQRAGKSKSKVFFVADDVHPQTLEVVKTRAEFIGFEVMVGRLCRFTYLNTMFLVHYCNTQVQPVKYAT